MSKTFLGTEAAAGDRTGKVCCALVGLILDGSTCFYTSGRDPGKGREAKMARAKPLSEEDGVASRA